MSGVRGAYERSEECIPAASTLLSCGCEAGCERDGESEPAFGEMVCTAVWVDHGPRCRERYAHVCQVCRYRSCNKACEQQETDAASGDSRQEGS